jgi:hypothetical protein
MPTAAQAMKRQVHAGPLAAQVLQAVKRRRREDQQTRAERLSAPPHPQQQGSSARKEEDQQARAVTRVSPAVGNFSSGASGHGSKRSPSKQLLKAMMDAASKPGAASAGLTPELVAAFRAHQKNVRAVNTAAVTAASAVLVNAQHNMEEAQCALTEAKQALVGAQEAQRVRNRTIQMLLAEPSLWPGAAGLMRETLSGK